MATIDDVADWISRYERAWRSNQASDIHTLFTDDAVYRWHPWDRGDDVAVGRDQIVKAWLASPDDPSVWQMECEPVAVNGQQAVIRCMVDYRASPAGPARTYHNIWLLRLDDEGRCSDFTEYFMREPDSAA